MVVHATYPDDTRVRREAEALLDAGWQVDVVCLRGEGEQPFEEFNHATVYRLPVRRHRGSGLVVYMLEYLLFCLLASIRIMRLQLRCGYDLVQIHNMPDFLVFTALAPRLWGARVLLDMHDLVPELYASRFAAGSSHLAVQIACLAERASVAFADHVITAGEPFRRRLIARGIPADKVTVIMNGADPRLFRLASGARPRHDDQHFTLIYHGSLFERYGLDIALEAVNRLRGQIPGLRLLIYGEGEAYTTLAQMVADLDLSAHVRLCGFAPVNTIPALIALADLEIVPYRRNPFTDMLYPSKAFECLALGVPVIMARTGAVAELFAGVEDMLFRPEDPDALAAHVLALYRDPERLQALLAASQAAYAPYAWDNQRADYVALVARLVAPHGLISQANR
jgi:glycosyltransferase involved in cell wall biosynthesis